MDIKNKLMKIRRKHFANGALIIASVLGFVGFSFLFLSFLVVFGYFGDIFPLLGILLIIGGFFFFLCIYIWYKFFINIILKPEKEILFLEKDEDDELYFIDIDGRLIEYDEKIEFEENRYYEVIKTSDYVLDVIGESRCDWNAKKKFYFWRTFYTPIGYFKNIVLLPILYVSFSIFIVLYLFSNDIIKYMSLAVCFPHIYVIVYDIYKKILNRKK